MKVCGHFNGLLVVTMLMSLCHHIMSSTLPSPGSDGPLFCHSSITLLHYLTDNLSKAESTARKHTNQMERIMGTHLQDFRTFTAQDEKSQTAAILDDDLDLAQQQLVCMGRALDLHWLDEDDVSRLFHHSTLSRAAQTLRRSALFRSSYRQALQQMVELRASVSGSPVPLVSSGQCGEWSSQAGVMVATYRYLHLVKSLVRDVSSVCRR